MNPTEMFKAICETRVEYLQEQFHKRSQENCCCDLKIHCNDGVCYANSAICAMISPIWNKELSKNSGADGIFELSMANYRLKDLNNVLQLAYTGKVMLNHNEMEAFRSLASQLKIGSNPQYPIVVMNNFESDEAEDEAPRDKSSDIEIVFEGGRTETYSLIIVKPVEETPVDMRIFYSHDPCEKCGEVFLLQSAMEKHVNECSANLRECCGVQFTNVEDFWCHYNRAHAGPSFDDDVPKNARHPSWWE